MINSSDVLIPHPDAATKHDPNLYYPRGYTPHGRPPPGTQWPQSTRNPSGWTTFGLRHCIARHPACKGRVLKDCLRATGDLYHEYCTDPSIWNPRGQYELGLLRHYHPQDAVLADITADILSRHRQQTPIDWDPALIRHRGATPNSWNKDYWHRLKFDRCWANHPQCKMDPSIRDECRKYTKQTYEAGLADTAQFLRDQVNPSLAYRPPQDQLVQAVKDNVKGWHFDRGHHLWHGANDIQSSPDLSPFNPNASSSTPLVPRINQNCDWSPQETPIPRSPVKLNEYELLTPFTLHRPSSSIYDPQRMQRSRAIRRTRGDQDENEKTPKRICTRDYKSGRRRIRQTTLQYIQPSIPQ